MIPLHGDGHSVVSDPIKNLDPIEHGRAALANGAWEEAVASLEAAAKASPPDPAVWELLGIACTWLQQTDRVIEARQRAYALYRERGDDLSAARASLELVWDFLEVRGEAAVANGWLQRARRLLEGLPVSGEHAVLGIWDAYMTIETDPAEAERHARAAVEIAHQTGAADAGALALALQGLARVCEGNVSAGMSLLDEAVAAAIGGEFSDPQWFYFACCCMIDACDKVRDFGRSLEWCHRLREFAQRWRVQAFLTGCRVKYSGALLWRGDWEAYEAELEHAMAEMSRTKPGGIDDVVVRLAELRRRQARRREAEALLARAKARPLALRVRAALALDEGDPAGAVEHVDVLLRRTPVDARTERVAALELKVRAHTALGQVEKAYDAAAELAATAEMIGTKALRAAALVARAVIASATSEHEQARQLFEDAIYLLEASGSPPEAARVRIDLANCLAALGRKPAAAREATAALATLEPLGAATEARRASRLLARLEDRPETDRRASGRRITGPGALTRRQREVLALVAQGLSDRDIATRLYLSQHTVHRHIANILSQLGVTSRTAAVARALRAELL